LGVFSQHEEREINVVNDAVNEDPSGRFEILFVIRTGVDSSQLRDPMTIDIPMAPW